MKKAQNGAKTPTEKEKVDAAIKAQKARKDTLGAAEKARRAKNLEANRRARLPLAEQAALRTKTKTTTQSGGGLSKYTNSSAPESKMESAPEKKSRAMSKPKMVRPTSTAITGPKRDMPSGMPKAPTTGIKKGPEKRTYSDTEEKILGVMDKGKKADGTMRESAQSRIKNIQSKAKRASARSERKEGRATKRTAVKTAKANLRAARKS
jgi:hypothetical protein